MKINQKAKVDQKNTLAIQWTERHSKVVQLNCCRHTEATCVFSWTGSTLSVKAQQPFLQQCTGITYIKIMSIMLSLISSCRLFYELGQSLEGLKQERDKNGWNEDVTLGNSFITLEILVEYPPEVGVRQWKVSLTTALSG